MDHARFKPCTSPHTTGKLGVGHHTFAVRGTDRAGYTGPIVVDSNELFSFIGNCAQGEVVINGGSGPAFDLRSTAGTAPMVIKCVTITGQDGIRTLVPLQVSETRFRQIPGTAVQTSSNRFYFREFGHTGSISIFIVSRVDSDYSRITDRSRVTPAPSYNCASS